MGGDHVGKGKASANGLMDKLYTDGLLRAVAESEMDHNFYTVLALIFAVKEPVNANTLARLANVELEIVLSILSTLKSFLIITDNSVQVLHKSFADMVTSKERCIDQRFFVDTKHVDAKLAERCLEVLCSNELHINMLGIPTQEYTTNNVNTMSNFTSIPAEVIYSAKYMATHLKTAIVAH